MYPDGPPAPLELGASGRGAIVGNPGTCEGAVSAGFRDEPPARLDDVVVRLEERLSRLRGRLGLASRGSNPVKYLPLTGREPERVSLSL